MTTIIRRIPRTNGVAGLQCGDACQMDQEHKDNVWQRGEGGEGEVWGCSPYTHLEAMLGSGEVQLPLTSPQGWEAEKSPWPGRFHYLI